MGDVIDFKAKFEERKIEVDLEDKGQLLLEVAIVSLWHILGGNTLYNLFSKEDSTSYHLIYLQFSGICFDLLEKELIIVDEEGDVAIESEIKEALSDAIENLKRDLTTDNHTTH